ncbi:MAG: hypothetical protein HQ592_10660 [Planctomycetes bacterium]|nr:hypothetical protein [Planctomycetota bacterium]
MCVFDHSRKVLFAFLSALLLSGCLSYRVEGLIAHSALKTYRRHALVGLSLADEQIVMAAYLDAFPGKDMTFVVGQRLQGLVSEQDIQAGSVNDEKREQIAETLKIDAIIFATYEHRVEEAAEGTAMHFSKLLLRIVDMTTGEISGSAIVTAKSRSEAPMSALAHKAVAELKARLGAGAAEGGSRRSSMSASERSHRRGTDTP